MNKTKGTILNLLYYDNHTVESLVSLVQISIIPIYWFKSFADSPTWMLVSLVLSGLTSLYGTISSRLLLRRAGSTLSLIFAACLVISCHRRGCEAEVAAAILALFCLWNYIRISFESSMRFLTYGDKK